MGFKMQNEFMVVYIDENELKTKKFETKEEATSFMITDISRTSILISGFDLDCYKIKITDINSSNIENKI